MSTDTKPADVLAVIDKHIQWTICRCVQSHCDIYERCPERLAHEEAIKARDAAASLLHEANIALGWMQGITPADKRARDRLRSAMARFRGVS